ncbi:MAG: cysteine desulfurase [Deltaproteobacteria bacterium]|nr:cysteine desulfurase [Deltaproteobacteria bacterium]
MVMRPTDRSIYLDNASTTRVVPEAEGAMLTCLREDFGNPSSAHRMGIEASRRIKSAREAVLSALGDDRGAFGQVLWTSGGTEADALGVMGAARARKGHGRHVVATAIEHPAVLGSLDLLAAEGFETTLVPVEPSGVVSPEKMAGAVRRDTVVVACMLVNNEIGTIQPVAEVARAVRGERRDVHIHCDAVQAVGKIPVDVRGLGVDTLALSAHKLHGPKGVGALWLRKGARLSPLWSGGGQEQGLRSGTENVPGIFALGVAIGLAVGSLAEEMARVAELRARFANRVLGQGLGAWENGSDAPRVPHVLSLSFPGLTAEPLLHALEGRGVFLSAGSACSSKERGQSHVLRAIGVPDGAGTLRVSLARDVTADDVDTAAEVLVEEARTLAR